MVELVDIGHAQVELGVVEAPLMLVDRHPDGRLVVGVLEQEESLLTFKDDSGDRH